MEIEHLPPLMESNVHYPVPVPVPLVSAGDENRLSSKLFTLFIAYLTTLLCNSRPYSFE
jgi:hypothetical protein